MQVEDVVKVSSKGQIVIPKRVRKMFGLRTGERLLLAIGKDELLLRKLGTVSLEEISRKTSQIIEKEGIDVDDLVEEAMVRARKKEKRKSK